ncbi:hypothetical protein OFC37_35750, partial [Escherichia coli]|nr:hypothetical protein [Escherichia coli]
VRTVQTDVSTTRASMTVQLVSRDKRARVFSLIPQWQRTVTGLVADQPSARVSINAGGGFRGQGSALQVNLASASFDLLN